MISKIGLTAKIPARVCICRRRWFQMSNVPIQDHQGRTRPRIIHGRMIPAKMYDSDLRRLPRAAQLRCWHLTAHRSLPVAPPGLTRETRGPKSPTMCKFTRYHRQEHPWLWPPSGQYIMGSNPRLPSERNRLVVTQCRHLHCSYSFSWLAAS